MKPHNVQTCATKHNLMDMSNTTYLGIPYTYLVLGITGNSEPGFFWASIKPSSRQKSCSLRARSTPYYLAIRINLLASITSTCP